MLFQICLKSSLSYSRVWGKFGRLHQEQAQPRKVFHIELDKITIINLNWNAQGKGFFLIGFLFYWSHILVGRPGYRIVCRPIKRGSRVSNLIVSFGESSNPCILGITLLFPIYILSM
jgi:hypothetical protein